MNCLSADRLAALAVGEPDPAARDHLDTCPACAAALARLEFALSRLADGAEADHPAGRQRLLAALSDEKPTREVFTMSRVLIGAAALAAAVAVALFGWGPAGPSALAQTAEALRQVKSYQCRTQMLAREGDKEVTREAGTFSWAAPGSVRWDAVEDGKVVRVRLLIRGKPGLEIDHKAETFARLEALHSPKLFLDSLGEVARLEGKPDRELPARRVGAVEAKGFEVAVSRLGAEYGEGDLRLWIDPTTKLPLILEVEMRGDGKLVLDEFVWDKPADKWFDVEPPAKYKDVTAAPPEKDPTEQIVAALKVYRKHCGKYPPGKLVFGDVAGRAMYQAAGLGSPSRPASDEDRMNPAFEECQAAATGLAWINHVQRHNPDSAYHGETVGPPDKAKVLLRWKLKEGDYRVIYGDLRTETVKADRLKELEGK